MSNKSTGSSQDWISGNFNLLLTLFILVTGIFAAILYQQDSLDTRSRASATGADLTITPASVNVTPNQEIALNISVNTHAHKITTAQLELTFDNTKFDFVSIVPGTALNESLVAGAAFGNKIYLTLGTKPVLIAPGPPAVYEVRPFTGTGTLAVLTLKAKSGASGTAPVAFNQATASGAGTIILAKDSGNTNVLGDKNGTILTFSGTISPSPTPVNTTITPAPMCTPVLCPTPGVLNCPSGESCVGGCGFVCATPTPLGPSPTGTQSVPGDADADGIVDGIDYVIWLNNYDKPVTGGASKGDFNGSGKVDGVDYSIWLANYTF